MNEACHIWMSHVTCESVMSHMNQSCLAYEWVTSHMNQSCHNWMRHVTYEWATAQMKESCHIWMSHVVTYVYFTYTFRYVQEAKHDQEEGALQKRFRSHVKWRRRCWCMRIQSESCQMRVTHSVCAYIKICVSLLTRLTQKRFWSATSSRSSLRVKWVSHSHLKWSDSEWGTLILASHSHLSESLSF